MRPGGAHRALDPLNLFPHAAGERAQHGRVCPRVQVVSPVTHPRPHPVNWIITRELKKLYSENQITEHLSIGEGRTGGGEKDQELDCREIITEFQPLLHQIPGEILWYY